MSIENLKKILESEREDLQNLFTQFDSDRKVEFIVKYPMLWSDVFDIMEESRYHRAMINSVLAGHNSATNRLLPLLQKAVEMAEWYSDGLYPNDVSEFNGAIRHGKRAREFLSEFAKMTEIKKEG